MRSLAEQPFWTAADESELSVLAWEVVRAANLHRDQCGICSRGGPWCEAMTKVVELVLEWREGRILKSKAACLPRFTNPLRAQDARVRAGRDRICDLCLREAEHFRPVASHLGPHVLCGDSCDDCYARSLDSAAAV